MSDQQQQQQEPQQQQQQLPTQSKPTKTLLRHLLDTHGTRRETTTSTSTSKNQEVDPLQQQQQQQCLNRNQIQQLISQGAVKVNGEVVTLYSFPIEIENEQNYKVEIDPNAMRSLRDKIRVFVFDKPEGVVCTFAQDPVSQETSLLTFLKEKTNLLDAVGVEMELSTQAIKKKNKRARIDEKNRLKQQQQQQNKLAKKNNNDNDDDDDDQQQSAAEQKLPLPPPTEKFKSFPLFPVGRLDKDSCGMLLMTNCGPLCERLLHPDFEHEKEYLVEIRRPKSQPVPERFWQLMREGVKWRLYGKDKDNKNGKVVMSNTDRQKMKKVRQDKQKKEEQEVESDDDGEREDETETEQNNNETADSSFIAPIAEPLVPPPIPPPPPSVLEEATSMVSSSSTKNSSSTPTTSGNLFFSSSSLSLLPAVIQKQQPQERGRSTGKEEKEEEVFDEKNWARSKPCKVVPVENNDDDDNNNTRFNNNSVEDAEISSSSSSSVGYHQFRITLTQGLNRQIRRMVEAAGKQMLQELNIKRCITEEGYVVRFLKRERVGPIEMAKCFDDDLKENEGKNIYSGVVVELKGQLLDSFVNWAYSNEKTKKNDTTTTTTTCSAAVDVTATGSVRRDRE